MIIVPDRPNPGPLLVERREVAPLSSEERGWGSGKTELTVEGPAW
jgi:hypothetical protein